MAAPLDGIQLPPGFVLDEPPVNAAPDTSGLPPGFVLDSAPPPPKPPEKAQAATQPASPGMFETLGRGIADRATNLFGGFLQSQYATGKRPDVAEFAKSVPWLNATPEMIADLQAKADAVHQTLQQSSRDVAKGTKQAQDSIGYKPLAPWESVKDPWLEGRYLDSIKAVPGFGMEQIITSIPDMAASWLTPHLAFLAQSGRMAEDRAANDKRDVVTNTDMQATAPVGALITAGERIGLGKIMNPGRGVTAPFKAGAVEAGTEAVQEGAEDIAVTANTEKGWNPAQTAENALAGAIGGQVGGTAMAVPGTIIDTLDARRQGNQPPPSASAPPPAAPVEPQLFPDAPPPAAAPTPQAESMGETGQPSPAPVPPSGPVPFDAEADILAQAGYAPEMIADMNPPERQAAVEEAIQQGIRPRAPSPENSAPIVGEPQTPAQPIENAPMSQGQAPDVTSSAPAENSVLSDADVGIEPAPLPRGFVPDRPALTVPPRNLNVSRETNPEQGSVRDIPPDLTGKMKEYVNNSRRPLNEQAVARNLGVDEQMAGRLLQQVVMGGGARQTRSGRYARKPTYQSPPSLARFVADAGGIVDTGGELRAADLHRAKGALRGIVRPDGLSINDMMEMALEEGFLQDAGWGTNQQRQMSDADFVQALVDDYNAPPERKIYRLADQAWAEEQTVKRQNAAMDPEWQPVDPLAQQYGQDVQTGLMAAIEESGIPQDQWAPAVLQDAARMISEGMAPEIALEQATIYFDADSVANAESLWPEIDAMWQARQAAAVAIFDPPPFPTEVYDEVDRGPAPQEVEGLQPDGQDNAEPGGPAEGPAVVSDVQGPVQSGEEAQPEQEDGTVELANGNRVPFETVDGFKVIRAGEQYVIAFPEKGGYHTVGTDYAMTAADAVRKHQERMVRPTSAPVEAGFDRNHEQAVNDLPDDQLKALGSRLGIKQGKASRLAFVERIAANPRSDVRKAYFEVVKPAAEPEAQPEPEAAAPERVAQPKADTPADRRIREIIGLDQAKIAAYDPSASVRKMGRGWWYETVDGNDHPSPFDTKKAAIEAATRHKELKQQQYDSPSSFYDVVSLIARQRLAVMKRLMDRGMMEMDAGRQADIEIPDVAPTPSVEPGADNKPQTILASTSKPQPLFKIAPNKFQAAASQRQVRQLKLELNQVAERILGHRLNNVLLVDDPATEQRLLSEGRDAIFDPDTGLIALALRGSQDVKSTLRHEAIHALRNAGVLTKQEWAALSRLAERQWIDQYDIRSRYESMYGESLDITPEQLQELLVEEAIADAMADNWEAVQDPDSIIGRITQKIRRFLQALRSMLEGRGFTSAEQVLADIEAGRMADREPGSGEGRGFKLYAKQASASRDQIQTPEFKAWFGKSAVVESNGEPLIVYHGTWETFDTFSKDRAKQRGEPGFWFIDNEEYAADYGDVMSVYLKIERPYRTSGEEWSSASAPSIETIRDQGFDGIVIEDFNAGNEEDTVFDSSGTAYLVFEPAQIKSATDNSGAFDPSNPSILASRSLTPPRNPAPGSFEAPHDERVFQALRDSTDTVLGRLGRAGKAFGIEARRKLQDREVDIMRTERAIKASGVTIPESQQVYLAASLYPGRTAQRDQDLMKDVIEPLIKDIATRKLTIEQVDDFLRARHAEERNNVIGSRYEPGEQFHEAMTNPDIVGGSGLSLNQANDIIQGFRTAGQYADIEAVADKVLDLNRKTLKKLFDEGLIEQATYDALTAQYQFYVPLRGYDEATDTSHPDSPRTGKRYDVRGKEFKEATGRTSKSDSPLAYSIMQARQAIVRTEKNRVGKRLLKLAQANPNEAFWQVNRKDLKKVIDKSTGMVRNAYDPGTTEAENVFSVKIGGKTYHVTLHHEGLLRAMKGLGGEGMHDSVAALHKVMRYFAAINTSYSPEFIVTNFFRDVQQTGIVLQEEQIKGLARKVIKSLPEASAGMFRMLGGDLSTPWAKMAREYADAGGKIGFTDRFDIEEEKANLASLMADENPTNKRKAMLVLRKGLRSIERLNDTVENTMRLATYAALRDSGQSVEKAAFAARELTVNFNRKGEWSPYINSLYLFFNAATQGAANMAMRLGRSKRLQKIVGGIVVGAFLQDVLNRMIAGDDDDDENRYDKIPNNIKSRFGIIMLPKWMEDQYGIPYLKWPLPLGYNMFHITGTQVGHAMFGARGPLEAAGEIVGALTDSFNPLGAASSFSNLIAPTIADPFVDLDKNENWFGEKIMPEPFDRTTPDAEKYFQNVGVPAKALTDTLSSLTGGSPERPGAIDISPESVEHLFEFATGGIGRLVNNTLSTIQSVTSDTDLTANKIPFVRSFLGQDSKYDDRDAYYEIRDAVHVTEKEFEARMKEGDKTAALRVRKEHAREFRMIEVMNSAEKKMAKLRKEMKAVKKMQGMSDAARKARVDSLQKAMDETMLSVRKRWNSLGN